MKRPEASNTRDIFLEALDLPAAERAGFLERACGGDPLLFRRVTDLLAEQETVGSFLEGPAAQPALANVAAKAGDQIGRYRLLQQIGEGGAGIVFMAEQLEPVRRRVALKVLKLGMDTRQVVARFEAERQALAMMDHRNIAAVFDAGSTETGRPYFVMELVRGTPITAYCDERNVSVETRLQLFLQVCHAIQHAHQKGVIHRDIKPSNILVTESEGGASPKVIDFGIAKAMEQPLTEKTLFTEFRSLVGTPAYMSPEQLDMAGGDVDTRSDIYSLGVLLYEILVGQTPFATKRLMQAGVEEFRRTVREVEPERPSNRLTRLAGPEVTTTAAQRGLDARTLERTLRGELDWIAMKCLEKDRGRRYATVNDLAADVQRFLTGEPVLARAPTPMYRARKFLRRHRVAMSAAAVVVLALVTASVVSLRQAATAREAERGAIESKARAERNEARALLNEYVADVTLAHQALSAGNFGRAHSLLEKHSPATGKADLRGFEWGYLKTLAEGDPHEVLVESGNSVRSVGFSRDGKLMAIGTRERLTVLDTTDRSVMCVSTGAAFSVAFAADNARLFVADIFSVRAIDLPSGGEKLLWAGSGAPLAVSADGSRLAAGGREGTRIFNSETWEVTRTYPRCSGPLTFSPDGKTLVTSSRNGLLLWPTESDGEPVTITGAAAFGLFHQHANTLAFSQDGKRLFAAQDKMVAVFDAKTGARIATMPDEHAIGHSSAITSAGLSPDGKLLATASWDHSIQIWDARNYSHVRSLKGHLNEVWAIAFAPDGKALLSGAKDGGVFLWSMEATKGWDFVAGEWQPLAFSKDEKALALLSRRTGSISLLDVESGALTEIFGEALTSMRVGRFSPPPALTADLKSLVRATGKGLEIVRRDPSERTVVRMGSDAAQNFAVAPDGSAVVTIARGGAVTYRPLPSGDSYELPRSDRAQFTSDSKRIILNERDGGVTVWNCETRKGERAFELETPGGFASALSPDDRLWAVGAMMDLSNTIELVDLAAGKTIGTLSGHKQGIVSIAFSPDGKTLASTSTDGALIFWNVATQQELLTVFARAHGVVFSPGGSYLAFATRTGDVEGVRILSARANSR